MSQTAEQNEINRLIADLGSPDGYKRQRAAKQLAKLNAADERVIEALLLVADTDAIPYVRNAARDALQRLGHELAPEQPAPGLASIGDQVSQPADPAANLTTHTKRVHFAIGFIGWYVIHTAWAAVLTSSSARSTALDVWILLLIGNVVVIPLLALIKNLRWLAFGALSALGLNLAVSLILGMFMNALCFAPPYIPLS